MVYNCLKKLQSVLYPPRCVLCLAPCPAPRELCDACRTELPWLGHACPGCALPLPVATAPGYCAACQKQAPQLDYCAALFIYRAPVDGWIQALKFHQDLAHARLLGQLLAETFPPEDLAPARLLPVPLHRRRLAQRGYNQALEITRPLLEQGLSLAAVSCRRRHATRAQSDLPAGQRRQNIRGAFQVDGRVAGMRLVLVDDVMTTGTTLNELARTLKDAGAARVEARVIARAI